MYDGFNIILSHMTNSLVECGIEEHACDTVFGLWGAYLRSLGVAFCEPLNPENEGDENLTETMDEETTPAEIAYWMLPPGQSNPVSPGNLLNETDADSGFKSEMTHNELPFVPYKMYVNVENLKVILPNFYFTVVGTVL